MIKLDLTYLQNSIQNSQNDFCEAGSVKSVNRSLGRDDTNSTNVSRRKKVTHNNDNAFKVQNKIAKTALSA